MKLRKKILYSILAAYIALLPVKSTPQSLGRFAKLLPEGYSELKGENTYRTKYKNNNYSGTLVSGKKSSAWFVYNTTQQEVIGDQEKERKDYRNLALTFEIERFDNLTPEFPASLRNLSENIRVGLLQYETTYKIPMFVLENGSRLEGILVGAVHTGGANLPTQVQAEFIKQVTRKESEKIKNEFFKKVGITEEQLKDPNNIVDLTEKIKKYFEITILYRASTSREKLEKAADLFERHKYDWTFESASECFNDLIEGHAVGRASLRVMNDLEKNVDWKLISKKISSHFAEGYAGIPAEQIFEFPEIQKILNNYNLYLEQELKLFMPMVGRFEFSDPESAASRFLNSKWPENKKPQPQINETEQVVINYLNALKTKNINVLSNLVSRNLSPESIPDVNALGMISSIYSCREFNISQIQNNIFYISEKKLKTGCQDPLSQRGIQYPGEIIYLRKEGSWKIAEIYPLTKEILRQEAKTNLWNLVTEERSYYAEHDTWLTFAPEPREIPDITRSPAGLSCNLPLISKGRPSNYRCHFSYRIKFDPNEKYIIEATGNIDSDHALEIWQIGFNSKKFIQISED